MHISANYLPQDLANSACSDFIQNAPLETWLPALQHLQKEFDLPNATWEKIPKGANALFALGQDLIIKLVPPNWRRQGDKEILVAPLLDGNLSLQTPSLMGSGEIDAWVFLISTRLPGSSLADVWPTLGIEDKHALMMQTGRVLREFRSVSFDETIAIKVDWPSYIQNLISSCMARHQHRNMSEGLLAQVMPYLDASGDFAKATEARFIHMDIHPWNLMAEQENGRWKLTGLLDFGDAIVGNSDRFELLTPLMFMAQGNPVLAQSLLDSYGVVDEVGTTGLQRELTACMLVRPDSDVGFCMQQVPATGPRETWEQVARQLFPTLR